MPLPLISPDVGNNTSVPENIDPHEDCDSDDDEQVIKDSIDDLLSYIKSSGSFATGGPVEVPLPGLGIRDVGLIGLPLNDHVAKAIINVSHPAPHGKGSDTLVDESVRKTWELNPDTFEFQNPAWNPNIQELARVAATRLGIYAEAPINAELYKLLLYEEGAMFKPHQEYADVMHEVRPVTSGYRLVVVYNLVQTSPGVVQTAAKLLGERDELGSVLAAWNRGTKKDSTGAPTFLLYQLEHEYTEESLKMNALKGRDKLKVDCLNDVCSKNGVGCYLASCEKMESGGCAGKKYDGYDDDEEDDDEEGPHALEDVFDMSLEIKRFVDLDGTLLASGIDVNEEDFIQDDPFARDPDHEDYEGYMGNSGPDATHFYYDSVSRHVYF
ncbi:MAG: hypothetical protein LQ352_005406 [Teloschistes flavicans]|nr:MAG: hypothetical protein LQ352_005406 [Teloschistes flavicans]